MSFVKPLENSILKTLAYFDILNFPLTLEELFRYLWQPPWLGYEEFAAWVGNPPSRGAHGGCKTSASSIWPPHTGLTPPTATPLEGGFGCRDGFYFLTGRENLIAERQRAAEITAQKLTKAHRAVKFIRSVPFLKAIFVCNSVGAGMAKPESDIDFFIVTEKNRIWIVRFFTNLVLRCLGLRTYGSHQRDRICLSFYVDAAHLDLAPWRVVDDDIHFAYWLNMMKPLYDPENYYEKFVLANTWVEKYVPNVQAVLDSTMAANHPSPLLGKEGITSASPPARGGVGLAGRGGGSVGHLWKRAWEAMWRGSYGNVVENEAKKLQLTKMAFSLKEKAKLGDNGVVVQDGIIKLHENDARKIMREKWLEKIKVL
ncbi:MAG: hypothetical protein EXS55_02045 [Candidatus Magasanikbacteria bacterium]|nr:hypothetical protein [Candidatus Magasanikbacteria bacterium]